MIPATIVARPDEDGFARRSDPDILPLPGAARGSMPNRSSAANKDGLAGRDIANALRYHGILFVTLGTIIAGTLGSLAWYLVPAKYTTYSMVLVSQNDPSILPRGPGDMSGRSDFVTYLKTQANIIKSSRTMIGALRDPKIARTPMLVREEDPISFLEDKIITEFSDTSQIIKVLLSGEDPVEIANIVNAISDYYIKEKKSESATKLARIEDLQKKKTSLEKLLRDKTNKAENEQLIGANGAAEQMALKERLRMNDYLSLQQQKAQLQIALARTRADLAQAQAAAKRVDTDPLPFPDLSDKLEADPQIREAKMLIARLRGAINQHRRFAENPDGEPYPTLQKQLDQAVVNLESVRQKVKSSFENDFRTAARLKATTDLDHAQVEMTRLEAMDKEWTDRLNSEFKDLNSPDKEKKLMAEKQQAVDEIAHLREQLATIDKTLLTLQVELDAPDRVSLFQRAEVPQKREIKKQIAITAVASVFGLALVGGLITLGEVRKRRVFGPADPLFKDALPLLGCVPEHGAPVSGADIVRLEGLDAAGRAFLEAVDKVKAVLCRQMQRRRMQAVLVTSAAPDEGKSILAWNVALSFARTDKRTLFIDGNLRNPGLHNHFEIASHPGLSELLRGEKSLQEVVQRTALANLWCIAAGVCDEAARQALDKERLRRTLERARHDFDVIIIDSCSIREAVDPLYLAQRVDASLLSVRTFRSRTTDVERACHRLSQLGTPLVGAVLTDSSGAAAVEL